MKELLAKGLRVRASVGAALILLVSSLMLWGDGFWNPPEGAAVLGRAGVRMTEADDASTITHNPANLMDLDRAEVMPSATIGYSRTKYTSPSGQSEKSEDPWRVLPAFYASYPVEQTPYTAGVGIHLPYGQSSSWDENGMFKYGAPYFAQMMTVNANPCAAAKLNDRWSVGAGVDLLWSQIEFKQGLPWAMGPMGPVGPGSELAFKGDGYGIGGNAGVTWKATERQRLAATYRSPVDVSYDGDFDIGNMPPPASLPPGTSASSDFDTEINFPTIIGLGYGVRMTDSIRVEADVEWIQHSRNDSLDLDIGNNNPILLASMNSTSVDQSWEDTWAVGLGADWRFEQNWTLRGGWFYIPSPIPDRTFSPHLAEGDQNVISVGVGFRRDAHVLDLAYAATVIDERDITDSANPAVRGSYEMDSHLMAVSYAYLF